jgi:hypothetical protein
MWKLGSGPQGAKFFWGYITARSITPINNTAFFDMGKTISQPQEVASLFSRIFLQNFSPATGIFPFVRRRANSDTQPGELHEIKI